MGPWCLIGVLLLLTTTAGDSTPHLQQHLKKYENLKKVQQAVSHGGGSGLSSSATQLLNSIQNSMNEGNGASSSPNVIVEEPEFTEQIENVTVPAGRNVKLGCSVKNLGSYKVAWMHFEQSAILTVHNHVITRNPRISVTHDKHDRHRTWYLHINNVQKEDKGRYMCQINTVAAKTQFGYLEVVVPPNIDDSLSSSDVIVREGSNISLRCRATGSPQPTVKWKRDDNSKISISKTYEVHEWEGDTLEITKISRLDMGAYLCIASNQVPPTVSKRIKVSVDFPPMLLIPHQLVGAPETYNVTIECFAEAYPTSLNYWTRGEGPIIHDSVKYKVESSIGSPNYKTHMKLTIFNITADDDGTYKCVAKNPRGDTDGTIRLYVQAPATTPEGIITTEWEQHKHNLPKSIYNEKNRKHLSNINDINSFEQKSLSNSDEYGWSSSSFDNLTLYRNSSSNILAIIKFDRILMIFCIFWILMKGRMLYIVRLIF